MKSLWNSFKIAFSMYSKIPMPQAEWTKENMKYTFCFFPWIGAVIGVVAVAAARAAWALGFEKEFISVLLVLIPILITGGIHVDGLLDTADAMSSWQERKRRLEILKDSNAGAFAVITAGMYFLGWYGAFMQIGNNFRLLTVLGIGYAVSRSLSGISVIVFPKARTDGTVAEFSRKAEDVTVRNVLIGTLIVLGALMLWVSPAAGGAAFVAALLIFGWYYRFAMKNFGGTTGDLAGCFLCVCELGMGLVLAVVSLF
jgi:adenosylcobinamide-GDP ribazoletransferase